MKNQYIFKRYEMKYMITKEQKEIIKNSMSEYMYEDKYGKSKICNIYFDTPNDLLIRRSIEKPIYKEKLRVRSYGEVTPDSKVFVELKKKYKGVVYKRRFAVSEKGAMSYLCEKNPVEKTTQITNEIDYFCNMYKELDPKMFLSYDREAFHSIKDQNFRVTFDENLIWRNKDLSLCTESYGETLIDDDKVIMEIKTALSIPLWMTHILFENPIYKISFSKNGKE